MVRKDSKFLYSYLLYYVNQFLPSWEFFWFFPIIFLLFPSNYCWYTASKLLLLYWSSVREKSKVEESRETLSVFCRLWHLLLLKSGHNRKRKNLEITAHAHPTPVSAHLPLMPHTDSELLNPGDASARHQTI